MLYAPNDRESTRHLIQWRRHSRDGKLAAEWIRSYAF